MNYECFCLTLDDWQSAQPTTCASGPEGQFTDYVENVILEMADDLQQMSKEDESKNRTSNIAKIELQLINDEPKVIKRKYLIVIRQLTLIFYSVITPNNDLFLFV